MSWGRAPIWGEHSLHVPRPNPTLFWVTFWHSSSYTSTQPPNCTVLLSSTLPVHTHLSPFLMLSHTPKRFIRFYANTYFFLVFWKSYTFLLLLSLFFFSASPSQLFISLLGKWRLSVGTPLIILSVGCFHYVLFTFLPCSCPGSSLLSATLPATGWQLFFFFFFQLCISKGLSVNWNPPLQLGE